VHLQTAYGDKGKVLSFDGTDHTERGTEEKPDPGEAPEKTEEG
jgi:hypothetical protein